MRFGYSLMELQYLCKKFQYRELHFGYFRKIRSNTTDFHQFYLSDVGIYNYPLHRHSLASGTPEYEHLVMREIQKKHISNFREFRDEFPESRCIVVSRDPISRRIGEVEAIYILDFLRMLWAGELF